MVFLPGCNPICLHLLQAEPVGFENELFATNNQEALLQRQVNYVANSLVGTFATPTMGSDHQNWNLDLQNNNYLGQSLFSSVSTGTVAPQMVFPQAETVGNISSSGTGITLRTRQPQNQRGDQQSSAQGTAPRRIRFSTKFQVGPVQCTRPQTTPEVKLLPIKPYFPQPLCSILLAFNCI